MAEKKYLWEVLVRDVGTINVLATNRGAAFRLAFRELIRTGKMKRQPPSTPYGGFKGCRAELAVVTPKP